jgi:hypothetical protein
MLGRVGVLVAYHLDYRPGLRAANLPRVLGRLYLDDLVLCVRGEGNGENAEKDA